jgi:hypothetical protein
VGGGSEKETPREGANRGLGVETGVGVACGKTAKPANHRSKKSALLEASSCQTFHSQERDSPMRSFFCARRTSEPTFLDQPTHHVGVYYVTALHLCLKRIAALVPCFSASPGAWRRSALPPRGFFSAAAGGRQARSLSTARLQETSYILHTSHNCKTTQSYVSTLNRFLTGSYVNGGLHVGNR